MAVERIVDFDDEHYDPFDEGKIGVFGDIENIYGRLRSIAESGGPVQRGSLRVMGGVPADITYGADQKVFVVFDYEIGKSVLNNPAIFSNDIFKLGVGTTFGNTLSAMNPPEHTSYRQIFQKMFSPRAVAEWSDSLIAPVVDELIGKFAQSGQAELVSDFIFPYPFEIIYRQLDLPREDRLIFHRLSVVQNFYQSDPARGAEAGRKLGVYFDALVNERRAKPGKDLISLLTQIELDGECLPDDVLISFLRQLINAAGDTTYRAVSTMMVGFLRDRPDQFEKLRRDRRLVPAAIEEALRWEGPVNQTARSVMKDVELGGVAIPAGSIVEVSTGLAGRDARYFPNPDEFDIERRGSSYRHMAFLHGPHICLGQHLARLEMQRALEALLDRLPNLRLDRSFPTPTIRGYSMRRASEIHVLFGPH